MALIRWLGALDERRFRWLALGLLLVLSAIKMRSFLLHGRFWAEEGHFFFQAVRILGPVEGLFYIFNGHLELVTNALNALASLLPLDTAPRLLTYLSFGLQLVPIYMILKFRQDLDLPRLGALALVVIVVGLPSAAEVWANSINLHFHFALAALLVAALPAGTGPRWGFRALLLVAGLSGIPPNILLPVFAVRAVLDGERERWVQTAILGLTCALQLALVLQSGIEVGARGEVNTPVTYLLAIASQSVFAPLLGINAALPVTEWMREETFGAGVALLIGLIGVLPLTWLLLRDGRRRDRTRLTLGLGALWLTLVFIATALGDKSDLVTPYAGGRYFYAPNVVWALLFLSAGVRHPSILSVGLALLVFTSALEVEEYPDHVPWPVALAESREAGDRMVEIWPEGWYMFREPPAR